MIATSSILNPIIFFNNVQDNYWQTPARNGPDRGNFSRYLPVATNFTLYFEADSAIAFVDAKKCSDNSVVGSFVVTSLGGTSYSCVVNVGVPTNGKIYFEVRGSNPLLLSEQLVFVPKNGYPMDTHSFIQYKNVKPFAGAPSNTLMYGYWNISFWQQKNPQTFEDIEIAPGEFTRLTNEIHRMFKLETEYYPSYVHEHIQMVLGLDYIFINNREWIMREQYSYDFTNKNFALAKGMITLTERKSILRNTI